MTRTQRRVARDTRAPALASRISGPIGVYVHIPFCLARCAYCDFVSYAGRTDSYDAYVDALVREIESAPRLAATTVYFGGGTPTVLGARRLGRVLGAVVDHFDVDPGCEVTCEANPDTVEEPALEELRAAGFNRLSIGAQSFDDRVLATLGRTHDAATARRAVQQARGVFENVSVDLIFASPGESRQSWQRTLTQAVALAPDHVSAYCLTLEEGTPLAARIAGGELVRPDDDLAADMMSDASERLCAAGYEQYEISNFARDGRRCAHNIGGWRYRDYLGFGAAAHSKVGGTRLANHAGLERYIGAMLGAGRSRADRPGSQLWDAAPQRLWSAELSARDEACEATILGLRVLEGMPRRHFDELWRGAVTDVRPQLRHLEEAGLLDLDPSVRLTDRGVALANEVFREFV